MNDKPNFRFVLFDGAKGKLVLECSSRESLQALASAFNMAVHSLEEDQSSIEFWLQTHDVRNTPPWFFKTPKSRKQEVNSNKRGIEND